MLTKSKFQIEDGPIFEGYTKGDHWNGWECPYFDYDVAKKILSSDIYCPDYFFDPIRKTFLAMDVNGDFEAFEGDVYEVADCGSMVLYPIGTGSWIWSKAYIMDEVRIAKNHPDEGVVCPWCNRHNYENQGASEVIEYGVTIIWCAYCSQASILEYLCP